LNDFDSIRNPKIPLEVNQAEVSEANEGEDSRTS
jgi:hypothetical protein